MYFLISLFLFFIAGASMGSFASAIIYRTRENLSYGFSFKKAERSFCPSCKISLKSIDLIPILSWLMQRGQCRYCNAKISITYLWLEIIAAIAGIVIFLLIKTLFLAFISLFVIPFILSFIFLAINDKIWPWRLLITPISILFFVITTSSLYHWS